MLDMVFCYADKLGISVNTVKTHCKRRWMSSKEIDKSRLGMQAADLHYCQECGEVVMQPPKRKFKENFVLTSVE